MEKKDVKLILIVDNRSISDVIQSKREADKKELDRVLALANKAIKLLSRDKS